MYIIYYKQPFNFQMYFEVEVITAWGWGSAAMLSSSAVSSIPVGDSLTVGILVLVC